MNKATAACGTPDINSWWTTQAYLTSGKLWTKTGQYSIDRATARSPWRWTHHTSEPFKYSRNYLLWTPFNPEELLLNINIQWLNKTKEMFPIILALTTSGEISSSCGNNDTWWFYYSMWPPIQIVLHIDSIILCDLQYKQCYMLIILFYVRYCN